MNKGMTSDSCELAKKLRAQLALHQAEVKKLLESGHAQQLQMLQSRCCELETNLLSSIMCSSAGAANDAQMYSSHGSATTASTKDSSEKPNQELIVPNAVNAIDSPTCPRTTPLRDMSHFGKYVTLGGHTASKGIQPVTETELKTIHRMASHDIAKTKASAFLKEIGHQTCWDRVRSGVRHPAFDCIVAIVIFANTIFMAVQTDWVAKNLRDSEGWMQRAGQAFTIFFVLDLLMRLVIEKHEFFTSRSWTWNVFDLIVVSSAVLEEILHLIIASGTSLLSNGKVLRVLRIVKLVRVLRALRAARFFRELRAIVYGIMLSFGSLFWACVLLFVTIFVFAVFTTQGVAFFFIEELENGPDPSISQETHDALQEYCGTFSSTMYSFWKAVSGGMDWGDVGDPLYEISPMLGGVFTLYVVFSVCAMLNVVTGVFVHKALKLADQDMDTMIIEHQATKHDHIRKVSAIFKHADADGSGKIDQDEFVARFDDPALQAFLQYLEIDLDGTDPNNLYKMLDFNGDGNIDIEEFVYGCSIIKGYARSLELARYMWENQGKTGLLLNRTRDLAKVQNQQGQDLQNLIKKMLPVQPLKEHQVADSNDEVKDEQENENSTLLS